MLCASFLDGQVLYVHAHLVITPASISSAILLFYMFPFEINLLYPQWRHKIAPVQKIFLSFTSQVIFTNIPVPSLPLYSQRQILDMLWYGLGRPVVTSEIGNWSVFRLLGRRFVFGIVIKKRRARAASSDAITTVGIITLLLYYVS